MAMMWRPYLFNKSAEQKKEEKGRKRPKTRLSVNINKVALLRNARGSNVPDLLKFAESCEELGAQGITVHPRPDQRHIRYDDIAPLKALVKTEFNIEGNPTEEFLKLVLTHKPHQCTLVPDAPDALTSDAGWNTKEQKGFLQDVVGRLQGQGIRVSLFVDANPEMILAAKETGAERIELYTGPYASNFVEKGPNEAIKPYILAAEAADELGIGINAGHDLNLENLGFFRAHIINLLEVSIGQALIADSLYLGLENCIKAYVSCIRSNKA